jgi:hypothetical protein
VRPKPATTDSAKKPAKPDTIPSVR